MVLASQYFLDTKLIYAFLLLIIFILFHLIKPKPKYQVMPTLMFMFKDMGKSRSTNFLRNLITNLLFLLQLLTILFLVSAAAKPYTEVAKETLFKNTVVVLDTSASMKAPYDGKTRFDAAKKEAIDALGSINTLILVKKIPQVVLVDESSGKTKEYIQKLKATDAPTNIYTSLSMAGSYAKPDSRIVVISDFVDATTESDLTNLRKTLESQGIKVDFIKLSSPVPNIGIVDLSIAESKTTAVIKNFNQEISTIRIKIGSFEEEREIGPNSREVFTFVTPPLTNKLEIDILQGQDEFNEDNVAYISAPSEVKKKVLLITNNEGYARTYVYNAFDVMKTAQVTVAIPPKIPDLDNYDVFIFKDVDPNLILPGTFKGVEEQVSEKGKAAIIMAQDSFLAINYQGLLPLTPTSQVDIAANVVPTGSDALTTGLEFGVTKKYFEMQPIEGRPTTTLVSADDKTPIVAYSKLGRGSIIYYGMLDENKQAEIFFGKSPHYFVFWKRTLDFITNTPSIKNLNYNTGNVITFPTEQTIETPSGKIKTKELLLDKSGLYTLQDRIIAINIADESESDVSKDVELNQEEFAASAERFKEKVPYELTDYFIYAALVFLFLELLYIKFRGDF
jgi:hypothetical protein